MSPKCYGARTDSRTSIENGFSHEQPVPGRDSTLPHLLALQCTPSYPDWSPTAFTAEFGAGVDTSTVHFYGSEAVPYSHYPTQQ